MCICALIKVSEGRLVLNDAFAPFAHFPVLALKRMPDFAMCIARNAHVAVKQDVAPRFMLCRRYGIAPLLQRIPTTQWVGDEQSRDGIASSLLQWERLAEADKGYDSTPHGRYPGDGMIDLGLLAHPVGVRQLRNFQRERTSDPSSLRPRACLAC